MRRETKTEEINATNGAARLGSPETGGFECPPRILFCFRHWLGIWVSLAWPFLTLLPPVEPGPKSRGVRYNLLSLWPWVRAWWQMQVSFLNRDTHSQ